MSIASELRRIRAIEKLIHGFDLEEGSNEFAQPKVTDLAHGRVGYERGWGYYVALAERLYSLIEAFEPDEADPLKEPSNGEK